MRAALIAVFVLMAGCSSCEEPVADPSSEEEPSLLEHATEDGEQAEPDPEVEAGDRAPAAQRPTRPATARERAVRLESMPADERSRLRRRSELLASGRMMAHEGDGAGALAAFEAALRLAPRDVTVMCEAGNQARLLERYSVAETHLEPAVEHMAPPRTLAMCLYNLGRVRESQGRPYDAHAHYTRSLRLRPNSIVAGRLAALDIELDELERRQDEDDALPRGVSTSGLFDRHFPTLPALAIAAGCEHWGPPQDVPAVPAPNVEIREAALLSCEDAEMREFLDFLCVRSDAGWAFIHTVARSDMGDTFGRLESSETASIHFEDDGSMLVLVSGSVDEVEGEAEAYWACESEHPDDSDAAADCFEEASRNFGPRQRWRNATRWFTEQGEWVGGSIDDPEPYFERYEAEL